MAQPVRCAGACLGELLIDGGQDGLGELAAFGGGRASILERVFQLAEHRQDCDDQQRRQGADSPPRL